MIALLLGLLLLSSVAIIGPGHLSYAGDGTLEAVAKRRLRNGWGVTEDWRGYAVLVAPADCALMGRAGWLIVGGSTERALVVDCENGSHAGTLERRRLLADVNREELVHRRGWLILK